MGSGRVLGTLRGVPGRPSSAPLGFPRRVRALPALRPLAAWLSLSNRGEATLPTAAGVRGLGAPGALPRSRPGVCISSPYARF